jgi:hypothetical protein
LSALRRSGRFMVMVSRPLSRFCRTMSFMRFAFLLLVVFQNYHRERSEGRSSVIPGRCKASNPE